VGHLAAVVIPAYNSASTLGPALASLDEQTIRSDLLVIVADNLSTDTTAAVARVHADIVLSVSQRGVAQARNAGLERVRSEFMLCLDADCVAADRHWAERHVSALADAPQETLATAGSLAPAPTPDRWACRRDVTPHPRFAGGEPLYAVGGNSAYRVAALRNLGGFPPFAADDAALGRLARAAGFSFAWIPEALVFHKNPEGWRGYYRQMRKIGRYTAELEGPPTSVRGFASSRLRFTLSSAREVFRGDPHEASARVLAGVAQTTGAVAQWRSDRRLAAGHGSGR
jgi:glycosyltransferase involved in cell wall biosynthesis